MAPGREGTRVRHHNPPREPDTNTSDWLTRIGQPPDQDRGGTGAGAYEAETDRRDSGYSRDRELESGRRSRQAPAQWDAEPDVGESRYGESQHDARSDWQEPRYDPPQDEDIDPYRIP